MARRRVTPLFPVACSPQRIADCLDVDRRVIDRAVSEGHLTVYQHGLARRILIQDVVHWIKTQWKITGARHGRHPDAS